MRVSIDHRTRYRFTEPQARLIQMLRLTPQDSTDQTVVNWHIGVDCDARLRQARDGFGNRVTMLYAEGPITDIEIAVQGEVLTAGDAGLVRGVAEPLPPVLFLRSTERTETSLAMREFAASIEGQGRERLDALNQAVATRFDPSEDHHDEGHSAEQVFVRRDASPRDFAHVLIALARELGVPARYVSGYHTDTAGDGHAPHAWVEVYVDGMGWIALDPSRGVSVDDQYVRLAVALDATGAAPVAGSRIGRGREALDVDVQIEAVTADE